MKKPLLSLNLSIVAGVAAILLFAIVPATQAQQVAQEQFNYSTGDVVGDNGGTGWLSAWQNPASGGAPPWSATPIANRNSDAPVASPGLTYSTLNSAGSSLSIGGKSAMREWDFADSPVATVGGDIWVSFLIDPTSVANKIFVLPFANEVAATPNYQYGAGAYLAYSTTWTIQPQIRADGTTSSYPVTGASLSINQNQTYLVVMQFINNGGAGADVENMWVDPDFGSSPDGTELTVTGDLDLDGWFMVRGGSTATGLMDEINIGDTYSDVIPVPEPSVLALAIFGGAVALMMPFRRAKGLLSKATLE